MDRQNATFPLFVSGLRKGPMNNYSNSVFQTLLQTGLSGVNENEKRRCCDVLYPEAFEFCKNVKVKSCCFEAEHAVELL